MIVCTLQYRVMVAASMNLITMSITFSGLTLSGNIWSCSARGLSDNASLAWSEDSDCPLWLWADDSAPVMSCTCSGLSGGAVCHQNSLWDNGQTSSLTSHWHPSLPSGVNGVMLLMDPRYPLKFLQWIVTSYPHADLCEFKPHNEESVIKVN